MKRGAIGLIILVVVLVLMLFVILLPFMIIGAFPNGEIAKATGTGGPVVYSDDCNTPRLPRIVDENGFAEAINQYVAKGPTSSPLRSLGVDFVKGGVQFSVNPAYIAAIAKKESSYGTEGIATRGTFNAFGRKAGENQPHVELNGVKWYRYESWQQSLYGQPEFIKRRYLDRGLDTFEKIIEVYAPRSENNTAKYIQDMHKYVGEIMALAGSAVRCSGGAIVQ